MNQQQATAIKLFDKEMKTLQQQSQRLEQRIDASNKAKEISLERLALQAQIFKKKQTLHQNGYLSITDFLTAQEELLQYQEAIANLDKELAAIQLDLSQIQAQQQLLPDKQNLKQTEIQQKLSLLRAHKIELESQYEVIQKAPKGGVVTAIQSKIGSQISRNTPLLSIIPNDSLLELQLLLPSRSAGFVQNGDNVNIRFDAFPYQKFGIMKGIIIKVDKALILPSDQVLPLEIEQAMYRVTATLAEQSIMAYGKNFPLKVGMLVEADIILESRTLLEWLLDPIYALRGKL
ncbi:HlyD family efflux transporter periplasmic adaptor subunit [Vibrio fortis]|uniref:HlyD family efflux transporter periplasmic adaptor subunit n=1 Tax=Vibrio fortis TaxID=212667 RepID=UPI0040675CB5